MNLFRSMAGMVTAKLTSGDIPQLLALLNKNGIELTQISEADGLTILVTVLRRDFEKLQVLAQKRGAAVQVVARTGIYWTARYLLARPLLTGSMVFLLLLACILPSRVLFIQVEGNINVPANRILEQAERCGIQFGASRREVRSERMKNKLLASIPELQWAGINTTGCTATITVEERTVPKQQELSRGVSSIVAVRDGIIDSCTVTKGTALCVPGQAVKAGQTLVSGYTDCGISIRATRAEAEVYANTVRELRVVTPLNYAHKGQAVATIRKYSLIIGKKRINFSKDSGISPTGCDKMYVEYYCKLPGGFQFPLTLAVEQWTVYESGPVSVSADLAQTQAEIFAKDYLLEQMISGQIQRSSETVQLQEDIFCLQGSYLCREMIGRVRSEEIIINNGKNN